MRLCICIVLVQAAVMEKNGMWRLASQALAVSQAWRQSRQPGFGPADETTRIHPDLGWMTRLFSAGAPFVPPGAGKCQVDAGLCGRMTDIPAAVLHACCPDIAVVAVDSHKTGDRRSSWGKGWPMPCRLAGRPEQSAKPGDGAGQAGIGQGAGWPWLTGKCCVCTWLQAM